MRDIIKDLSMELGLEEGRVRNVVKLIDEGNTIPFIARYRKEAHGSMDDTTLRRLEERLAYLRNLQARREEILKSIEAQGKLSTQISAAVDQAGTLSELEDIYRPYKQKRRTRASVAREKGLEPLAALLFSQRRDLAKPEILAADYTDAVTGHANGVATPQEALSGASDIIAEDISDMADVRKKLRVCLMEYGDVESAAVSEEDSVYSQYYHFCRPIRKLQDHQVLALNRGEKEKFLRVCVTADHDRLLVIVLRDVLKRGSAATEFVGAAALDSLDRLMLPSLEREIRAALTQKASEGAIRNFALNLKPLLMQPPVRGHVTMGLDPGYRMGCKVAVVDETGKVLDTTVVYPTHGERRRAECIRTLEALIRRYGVSHIAIGNGTASRETEDMAAELIALIRSERAAGESLPEVSYAMVNEAGASVYSASELAAKEFPDFDVNVRSAVSIARRLQDPLAELVKIDPKAIGVGQYQHDMPQKELDASLRAVVEDCVNAVGVDLNTASPSLLGYVSGINSTVAANIVTWREENGAFMSRSQLRKVPRLGAKAYEQCAGFLRVPESEELLDNTGVHPESYAAARQILAVLGYTSPGRSGKTTMQSACPGTLGRAGSRSGEDAGTGQGPSGCGRRSGAKLSRLPGQVKDYGEETLAAEVGIGVPTLQDIVRELANPGRDPRDELPPVLLRRDVMDIGDLRPGMKMKGTVRNVIDFGAFVDIGVHQDGLVHISEISDRYIHHPSEALKVGDTVDVVVLSVDEKRKRISLSIKQAGD